MPTRQTIRPAWSLPTRWVGQRSRAPFLYSRAVRQRRLSDSGPGCGICVHPVHLPLCHWLCLQVRAGAGGRFCSLRLRRTRLTSFPSLQLGPDRMAAAHRALSQHAACQGRGCYDWGQFCLEHWSVSVNACVERTAGAPCCCSSLQRPVSAAVVGQFVPVLLSSIDFYLFLIFGICCLGMALYVYIVVPETKVCCEARMGTPCVLMRGRAESREENKIRGASSRHRDTAAFSKRPHLLPPPANVPGRH